MIRAWRFAWNPTCVLGCGLAACASVPPSIHGPIPVRNQHPAQLTVLHLDPVAATALPQGLVAARVSTAYTSMFLGGSTATSAFAMDGEIMRTSLGLRTGIGSGLEIGFEAPLLHTTSGFMDSFLIGYHDLFGFPDQGRSEVENNRFQVFAEQDGHRVYELREASLEFGDVPISGTCTLIPVRRTANGWGDPGLAARFGVELPTGDEDAGFGNGQVDYALGLCATWPLPIGALHAEAQRTFAGSPRLARNAGYSFADVTAGSLTLELQPLRGLGLLAQCSWETAALADLELDRANRDAMLLWLGSRLRLEGDLFLEVGFGEDLSKNIAPDFTAWLSMAWLPGGVKPTPGH